MMKATQATVESVTIRVERVGHKLHTDNFLSSPDLFDDLHKRAPNCCGTVRQNCKGMPWDFDQKTRKLKWVSYC